MLDEHIVALYWARDEFAIQESNAHYGSYCRRIAMNILHSPEDTEECVSDTWLRAWNAMPPEKPKALSAFFGRIVRNLSLDRYRRDHAKKRYGGLAELLCELEDCLPAPVTTEQAVETAHLSEIISGWLESLPADERRLFVRRYWFGDAVRTLAREYGLTQNQMAQRMFRLRGQLRLILEREEIDL